MKPYLKWVMPGIQAVVTAVLLYMLISSRLLPSKYMAVAIAAALVPLVITGLMARSGKTALNTAGSILAIFLSGTQIETIAVAVQDSNAAQSVEETGGYLFGVYEGANKEYLDTVLEEVKEANGDSELKLRYYETPVVMGQDLLDGNLDAVICNKAYIDLLDDAVGEFSQKTRVILEKEFETQIEEGAGGNGSGETAAGTAEARLGSRQRGENPTEHPFNILISGIDVHGPISTTSRSDVNIIMTVNPLNHRILRDLRGRSRQADPRGRIRRQNIDAHA